MEVTSDRTSITVTAPRGAICEFYHQDAMSAAALELREEFKGKPRSDMVAAFLERTFTSYERDPTQRDGQLLTIWQGTKTMRKRGKSFADRVQEMIEREWAQPSGPLTEKELQALVDAPTDAQQSEPLDDNIYVVFFSAGDTGARPRPLAHAAKASSRTHASARSTYAPPSTTGRSTWRSAGGGSTGSTRSRRSSSPPPPRTAPYSRRAARCCGTWPTRRRT